MAAKTPEFDLRDNPFRNYLINGDMRVAQRGTSFVAVTNSSFTIDRMQYFKSGAMVHTASQDTDAPTLTQAGYLFQNSLRLNLTTPDTTIAAGDQCQLSQKIEGYNWARIAQKKFTLSFWVKATLTGTYCVAFRNTGLDRSYVAEYTIDAGNTWEKKTITVAASPAAGTWNYTNSVGLEVSWTLASGTTFQTTANAWQTGNFIATANQVNGVNTGATDFRVTGIVVNEGVQAAEFRLAGESWANELAICQRYYEKSYQVDVTPGTVTSIGKFRYNSGSSAVDPRVFRLHQHFVVTKRGIPTVTGYSPATGASGQFSKAGPGTLVLSDQSAVIEDASMSGFNLGVSIDIVNILDAHWTADAEL